MDTARFLKGLDDAIHKIIWTDTTDTVQKVKKRGRKPTGKTTVRYPTWLINLKKCLPTKQFENLQKTNELVILTS